jgi:glycosyltransferase involved in cell wall biosynthesis
MRILCVHQGYELYGSDRSFIECVAAIREAWPGAEISVVLPREGAIVAPLAKIASHIDVDPIWVLRRRGLAKLATLGLFRLIPAIWRAAKRMRSADLVYINTIVIADYLLAARFFNSKTLIHVHEIPDGVAAKLFRSLLLWTRAEMIFNSNATKKAFALPPSMAQHVVYNGVAGPAAVCPVNYDGSRPLRLLMIGRINRIKGQDILIDALASLPRNIRDRLEVRIVGGSFDKDASREGALHRLTQSAGLASTVRFEPFRNDPSRSYEWADIVVVPSRLPESLGRVAIEAMAYGRPAIASAIGGLTEVVQDGVTGWLVPPNDPAALARTIAQAVTRPETWRCYSTAARARYEAEFGHRAIDQQLQAVVRARLARPGMEQTATYPARIGQQ